MSSAPLIAGLFLSSILAREDRGGEDLVEDRGIKKAARGSSDGSNRHKRREGRGAGTKRTEGMKWVVVCVQVPMGREKCPKAKGQDCPRDRGKCKADRSGSSARIDCGDSDR